MVNLPAERIDKGDFPANDFLNKMNPVDGSNRYSILLGRKSFSHIPFIDIVFAGSSIMSWRPC
jgi:hypothetical protein